MTVPNTNSRDNYTGNGAVSAYDYNFKINDQTHLLATIKDLSNLETTLVLTTDFTLSGVGDKDGGTLSLVDSSQSWLDGDGDLLTGYLLTLRRVLPFTQNTDIRNQGSFFPEVHEDEFDNLTFLLQQLKDEADRSLKFAETSSSTNFDFPEPEANKVIVWNAAGTALVNIADVPTGLAELNAHIADLTAHGATGEVVGTTNTQTLTNKTLTSPILNTPTSNTPLLNDANIDGGSFDGETASLLNFIKVPSDTTSNLTALARTKGKMYYSSDDDVLLLDNGATLDEVNIQPEIKVFSAHVTNNGTAAISQQSQDETGANWITSVNRSAVGKVTVTLNGSVVDGTDLSIISTGTKATSDDKLPVVINPLAATFEVHTWAAGSGSLGDFDFYLLAHEMA